MGEAFGSAITTLQAAELARLAFRSHLSEADLNRYLEYVVELALLVQAQVNRRALSELPGADLIDLNELNQGETWYRIPHVATEEVKSEAWYQFFPISSENSWVNIDNLFSKYFALYPERYNSSFLNRDHLGDFDSSLEDRLASRIRSENRYSALAAAEQADSSWWDDYYYLPGDSSNESELSDGYYSEGSESEASSGKTRAVDLYDF